MPVIFQKLYKRVDARMNPDVLYVFGDNVMRKGLGGQAGEMRGESNAVGVATKLSPYTYFGSTPEETLAQNRIIDNDMKPLFQHVITGGIVVWPTDGIGTGLADLVHKAPDTFDYLEQKLASLISVGKVYAKHGREAASKVAEKHVN